MLQNLLLNVTLGLVLPDGINIQGKGSQDLAFSFDVNVGPNCPPVSIKLPQVGNKTYCAFEKAFLTFKMATMTCLSNGLQLAAIENNEELQALKSFASDRPTGLHCYWIGAQNKGNTKRTFLWLTTNSQVNDAYWNTGEPNNEENHENCVQLAYSEPDGLGALRDRDCAYRCLNICQTMM